MNHYEKKFKSKNIKKARKIKQEDDTGNIEYKITLSQPRKIVQYATQMKYRIFEGEGKAIYNIGYSDNGEPTGIQYHDMLKSLENLHHISDSIQAKIKTIKIFNGISGFCANILINGTVNDKILDHFDLDLLA